MTFRAIFLLTCLALTGATAHSATGGGPSGIGQLPGEKLPEVLLPKERNPFTRRDAKPSEVTADHESEESQLRALIRAMPVTGVVRGGPSDKVLLGSLILEPGSPVPPLLKRQTEQLVVAAITGKQVEIQFVETEAATEPRRIFIPIDLHPRVAVRLPTLPKVPEPSADDDVRTPE